MINVADFIDFDQNKRVPWLHYHCSNYAGGIQLIRQQRVSSKLGKFELNYILFNYRPHPKDGESNIFSLFTLGGYSVPGLGGGVHHQGLDGGGDPISGLGGSTPSRSGWWGVPHLRSGVGVHQPGLDGWGVPHLRSGVGVPQPGLEVGGYPIPGVGRYPGQVWMGEIPWPGLDFGGGTQVPPARSGWWGGTLARYGWWGGPGVPLTH